ncbi:MAG: heat-inducible transcription repressor HrcA [Geobacter sp.]|nr:heat-inducible transcription repressor HrcA [Geobacter sp.]
MSESLNERSKRILEAIIEDYISTAEPVGSRAVLHRHGFALSPATIRNVMSDLEECGFLASPHTSAGRVPTAKAYRLYVDSLLQLRGIAEDEEAAIRRRCSIIGKDVAEILKDTSRTLSTISHYTGIVLAPRLAANIFRHIEFVKLGQRRILAILVSEGGIVQNKIFESDAELSAADLGRMSNYLNDLLHGLTMEQVRRRVLEEMQNEKVLYDTLLKSALEFSEQALEDEGSEVFIEGQANILEQPEFADLEKMKEIFRAFEEKNTLVSLLDRCMSARGVNIFIGAESRLSSLEGLSIVTSSFRTGANTLGVLGVIGPTRMGYGKVIPIVDYTAKLISNLLNSQ